MKNVLLAVRESFVVPDLYTTASRDNERTVALVELALKLGAKIVNDIQRSSSLIEPIATSSRQEIEEIRQSAKEKHDALLASIEAMRVEHQDELDHIRSNAHLFLADQKIKMRAEINAEAIAQAKRETEREYRELMLTEKEKNAADRETLTKRLEDRYAMQAMLAEKRHAENLQNRRLPSVS